MGDFNLMEKINGEKNKLELTKEVQNKHDDGGFFEKSMVNRNITVEPKKEEKKESE